MLKRKQTCLDLYEESQNKISHKNHTQMDTQNDKKYENQNDEVKILCNMINDEYPLSHDDICVLIDDLSNMFAYDKK